jgi:anthranilate synthase component 1
MVEGQLGDVLPLLRRLPHCPDPLALFAAATDGGRRPDTLLLESADMSTLQGERSILVLRSALRIEARGRTVTIQALTANGDSLLPWLQSRLDFGKTSLEGRTLICCLPVPTHTASEKQRQHAITSLDVLRKLIFGLKLTNQPTALALAIYGVFSYDLLEAVEKLPAARVDLADYPDYVFWLPESMAIINHKERFTTLLAHVYGGEKERTSYADAMIAIEQLTRDCERPHVPSSGANAGGSVDTDQSDEDYMAVVEQCRRHIVAGDVFQIVPSRTFSAPCADPLASYARLRQVNPSPYMFYVRRSEDVLFGSSPETCLKVSGQPLRLEITPLAGTRPRGFDAAGFIDQDLDSRLEAELKLDQKELAEHMMLVDLARNDVARVSEPGTRRVDELLTVDRFSHVMHLVSRVSGVLRPELDALHAYAASMNMGTLVGAPKVRAAELLRQLEPTRRGTYGGAVGYLSADGQMDTAIVIRSAQVRDGVAYVRAGAGVVYDSDPLLEAEETRRKAQGVLKALTTA